MLLTALERDVPSPRAEGYTRVGIGRRLWLSGRMVETHVGSGRMVETHVGNSSRNSD